MRAAHRRVLAIDEGVILLAVVPAMGERHFDIFRLDMDDRIQRIPGELFLEEIRKAALRFEILAVEIEGQPTIQVGVIPHHLFDEFLAVGETLGEELLVRRELDVSAVALIGFGRAMLLGKFSSLELDQLGFAIPDGLSAVGNREGIDRLLTDAIEAYRFLERLTVVFGAGVDDRNTVDQLPQRNAAAVIAHANRALGKVNFDPLAKPHRILVDAVIYRLLE